MKVKVDPKRCTGCGVCKDFCPVMAIKIDNKTAVVSDDCIECGACISQCPAEALIVSK